MAYIFTIIFISKLVSVEMASLLGIQIQIQAVWKMSMVFRKIFYPIATVKRVNCPCRRFFLMNIVCIKSQIQLVRENISPKQVHISILAIKSNIFERDFFHSNNKHQSLLLLYDLRNKLRRPISWTKIKFKKVFLNQFFCL